MISAEVKDGSITARDLVASARALAVRERHEEERCRVVGRRSLRDDTRETERRCRSLLLVGSTQQACALAANRF